jgi:hypothetical protein
MSVENLIKELESAHAAVRSAESADDKIRLMAVRDAVLRELSTARHLEAEYHQQQIRDLENNSRPKTFQTPSTAG